MNAADFRELVGRVSSSPLADGHSAAVMAGIEDSVAYLESAAALASIARDPYWPKWHSPWWHMLLLWELGESARIPVATARALVARIGRLPLHEFPTDSKALAPGLNLQRDTLCHCGLGCIDQMLATTGIAITDEVPWTTDWFPHYQMADGGLNCDNDAYLVKDEIASSMVATVPALESLTRTAPASWSAEHRRAVDNAIGFLVDRELVAGSASVHNAEERTESEHWPLLKVPQFYGYDLLRGLAALLRAVLVTQTAVPMHAVTAALESLLRTYPDGVLIPKRQPCEGHGTRNWDEAGEWKKYPEPLRFPLFDAVSTPGIPSPYLASRWARVRSDLLAALDAGLLHAT